MPEGVWRDRQGTAGAGGSVAVVGAGAAGLAAAWALTKRFDVELFEARDRLGGHCNTVEVADSGRAVPVDTGFIVFNPVNYPNLTRAFGHLGVATEASDMSFSVSVGRGRFEYAGSWPGGLLAQKRNVLRPAFWRMLSDVRRFYATAADHAAALEIRRTSLSRYLADRGFGSAFRRYHLLPMAAAIWSQPVADIGDMPAATLIRFFEAHGLLRLRERPRWRTVSGGSRHYVERIRETLRGAVHLSAPAERVRRAPDGVWLRARGRERRFDHVVLAVHADRALALLGDATPEERAALGPFRYRANRAVLHDDPRLMPVRRATWASWNFIAPAAAGGPQGVTYWMNRLQNLETARPLFVSLNPPFPPGARRMIAAFDYDHPVLDQAAVDAQRRLPRIQGIRRTWFCGSYFGYGFHEDAFASGLRAAAALGAPPPWETSIGPGERAASDA